MVAIGQIDGMELQVDDNFKFFDSMRAFISHSDGDAKFSMYQKDGSLTVHITPSDASFKQDIINSLLAFKKIMNLKIIFSSSLGISKTISFTTIL